MVGYFTTENMERVVTGAGEAKYGPEEDLHFFFVFQVGDRGASPPLIPNTFIPG